MDSIWILLILGLLFPCGIHTADYGTSGPLSFHCPGNEDMIVFVEHGQSLQSICGPDFGVMFNGSIVPLTNGQLMFYFSSFPDPQYGVNLLSPPLAMGSSSSEWSLTTDTFINQSEIPCGTGYIVAEVDNSGMKYMAAQRGVRVCNFSDVDLELQVDVTMLNNNTTVHLYPGDRLMTQLERQGVHVEKITVRNNGHRRVDNFTMENPKLLMVYLRHYDTLQAEKQGCLVPAFTLSDAMLGMMMFVDGIGPYQEQEVTEKTDESIVVNFDGVSVCGDAELVIMFDPLGIINDSNRCNNFERLPVHVECGMMNQKDVCMQVPNALAVGREAIMMFQEMQSYRPTMYKYQSIENTWQTVDVHVSDRRLDLIGLAKFVIIRKLLNYAYQKYYNDMYPCETVMADIKERPREMFSRIVDHSNYTLNYNVTDKIRYLMNRISNINVMTDNSDLLREIEMFGNDTGIYKMDDVMKARMMGIGYGLQTALSINHMVVMTQMMNKPLPANITRVHFGPMLKALAEILLQMADQHPMARMYMIPSMVTYAAMASVILDADIFPIPQVIKMTVRNIVENILDFPQMVASDVNVTSTCGKSPLRRMAKFLMYVSGGYDGEIETALGKDTCSMLMVTSYMQHGGAYVVAKDILKEVEAMKTDACQSHPYIPIAGIPIAWTIKDGRIMKGSYSPLGDVVTWKVVAVCRCDGCSSSSDYTTTSSWDWKQNGQTTYGGGFGG